MFFHVLVMWGIHMQIPEYGLHDGRARTEVLRWGCPGCDLRNSEFKGDWGEEKIEND